MLSSTAWFTSQLIPDRKAEQQIVYQGIVQYHIESSSIISLHERPQVLEELRTPINRTGRSTLVYKNDAVLYTDDIDAQGTHIQQHSRNVQQRREEKQTSPSENCRHKNKDQLLHGIALLRRTPASALAPTVPEPRGRRWRPRCSAQATVTMHLDWRIWLEIRQRQRERERSQFQPKLPPRQTHYKGFECVWLKWERKGENWALQNKKFREKGKCLSVKNERARDEYPLTRSPYWCWKFGRKYWRWSRAICVSILQTHNITWFVPQPFDRVQFICLRVGLIL